MGGGPIATRLAARLGSMLVAVAGVVTLTFLLIHLVPGDPVAAMLGESARPADLAALRASLGLDRPFGAQFLDYLTGLLRGDLGESLRSRRPILELLLERLPATLELAGAALLCAIAIGLPLGVVAARHQGRGWDHAAVGFSVLGLSLPNFWLGPLLILLFALGLGWLPVSGRDGLAGLVLPALTLGTGMAAILTRMVRSSLLEVLGEEYIRTARAKGARETAVVWRHALPNAALPVLTLLGLQLGALLGGAVVTEVVFSWPGIGSLMVEAIQQRDYPVVQGAALLISLGYVGVNALTDLVYLVVDPRIRAAEQGA